MKILVKLAAALAAFVAASWFVGGGYVGWRLGEMGKAHQGWVQADLLTQWGRVILFDHPTQILLLTIVAIVMFSRFIGRYHGQRYARLLRQCRDEAETKSAQERYWHARLN